MIISVGRVGLLLFLDIIVIRLTLRIMPTVEFTMLQLDVISGNDETYLGTIISTCEMHWAHIMSSI